MKRRQLDLFRDLASARCDRRQTAKDMESIALDAAARAHRFQHMGEGAERRAIDSAYCAIILFGAAYILEQRQANDRSASLPQP